MNYTEEQIKELKKRETMLINNPQISLALSALRTAENKVPRDEAEIARLNKALQGLLPLKTGGYRLRKSRKNRKNRKNRKSRKNRR
jgi:hypothetical protein